MRNTRGLARGPGRAVTFELLRAQGLTTIFGNVGSTEETFLAGFPPGFRYVLGLQEASVVDLQRGEHEELDQLGAARPFA